MSRENGMTEVTAEGVRIRVSELRNFAQRLFATLGLPHRDAEIVADVLVRAEARGVVSHGVTRIPIYAERLRRGLVNPRPRFTIVQATGPVAVADGDNGPGPVLALRGMEEAIRRAQAHGVGIVGVRNSNHCGMLAYYVLRAVEAGMIGVALSNAPATLAPWGAIQPYLGTNPLAVGIPTGSEMPVVLDMAMSVVARGKIIRAAERGEEIPEGWALGPDGRPTRDPHQALAGVVLPFGGPKGSGLALIVEVLTGVLLGGPFGPQVGPLYDNPTSPQQISHLLVALDLHAFGDPAAFRARMDRLLREIHALPPAEPDGRVCLPGEVEWLNEQRARRQGILLPADVAASLARLGEALGVLPPWQAADPGVGCRGTL